MVMRAKILKVMLVMILTLGSAQQLAAQLLTNYSFDLVLQGDDPGEVFNFTFPFDPLAPSRVTFNGYFENLDGASTGVNYYMSWSDGGSSVVLSSGGFVQLAGSGQLPVSLDQTVGFTPTASFVHIEGGGPSDHFRFVGDFAIHQVPEPGMFTLLSLAAGVSWFGCLYRRRKSASAPKRV